MNRWNGGSLKRVSISKAKQDGGNKKRKIMQQVAPLPITMQSTSNATDSSHGSKIFRIQSTPVNSSNGSAFQYKQQEFSLDVLSLQQQENQQSTTPQLYETNITISRSYSATPVSINEDEEEKTNDDIEKVQGSHSRSSSRTSFNSTPNYLPEVELPKNFSKQISVASGVNLYKPKPVIEFKPISPSLPNFTSENDIESIPIKDNNITTTKMDDASMKHFIFNNNESKGSDPLSKSISVHQSNAMIEEDQVNFLDLIGCSSSKESKNNAKHLLDNWEQQDSPSLQLTIPTSFLDSQPQQGIPFLLSPKTPSMVAETNRKEDTDLWDKSQMQQQIQSLQQENAQLKLIVESLRKQIDQLSSKNSLNLFSNGAMG